MAKRDKLYTVNKWNRPFFEEERKKKLYAWGGFNPYVHEGLASQIYGYGNTGGIDASVNMPSYLSKAFKSFDEYKNPTQSLARVYNADNTNMIGSSNPTPQASPIPEDNTSNQNWVDKTLSTLSSPFLLTATTNALARKAGVNVDVKLPQKVADISKPVNLQLPKPTTSQLNLGIQPLTLNSGLQKSIESYANANPSFQHFLMKNDVMNKSFTGADKLSTVAPQTSSTGTNFFNTGLGKGVALTALDLLGTGIVNAVTPKDLRKTTAALVGNAISTAATTGAGIAASTGVGLPIAAGIVGAGKLVQWLANQFGSVRKDNGTSDYIRMLEGSNPQGSNEFLAKLQIPYGPEARYTDGLFTDSGKNWARKQNNHVLKAYEDYQRKIRHAIDNNNWIQMQHAIYDSNAMGGKLNRKKCNCKADGGLLNSGINPSTPAGYDILQTSLIEQKAKNQANQNISGNIGNSFTSKLFSGGGYTNPLLQELMTVKPISSPKQLDLNSILGRDEYGVYPLNEIVVEAQRPAYALTGEDPYPIPSRYIPQSEVTAKYTDSPVETYDNSVILESDGKPIIGGYVRVANSEGHTRNKNRYKGKFEPNNVLYDYEPGDTLLDLTLDYTGTGTALGLELSGLPLHAVDAILGYPRRHYMRNGRYSEPFYAKGGPINIKKSHRGRLTELKKRTGKTEAELYNDGNPAHKKMVTFARNARKFKKAYGGFIDAANNLSEIEKTLYGNGGTLETKDKDYRNNSFLNDPTLFALGGTYQAAGSNWGNTTEINEGGTHEENPYEGVQVGVDPEGTPNLVEEGEVIFNDYVFSNRIKVPKEVCKRLRIGQKKDGFTFADAAKKLLVESKERPNDPISKKGLEANMQILEEAQEEVKKKMEAEEAVEQFNNIPPEQQVAIMNQEGQKAQDAMTQEQLAQEMQNLPPEQQQAIAQQMAAEQSLAQGVPLGQPSPEEQAMMQLQIAQLQMPQSNINPQEALAQAAAMQQLAINGSAYGGKLCFGGRKFAEGGELVEGSQERPEANMQTVDSEMAKYSDEELQDMIEDYQEAESGEVKVTKGKLARLKKKAEKAERELERRHSEENAEQPQEERQEPSQEKLQAAAQALAQQQMMEGQPQEGISPEQAMMMQQQMGGQPLMSPEEMTMLQQQQGGQYAYGGKLYMTGGELMQAIGFTGFDENNPPITLKELGITDWWHDQINPENVNTAKIFAKVTDPKIKHLIARGYNPLDVPKNTDRWFEADNGKKYNWGDASRFKEGYTKQDLEDMAPYLPYLSDIITALDEKEYDWSNKLSREDLMKYIERNPQWRKTNAYLRENRANRLAYLARRWDLMDPLNVDQSFLDTWTKEWKDKNGKKHGPIGKFDVDPNTGNTIFTINDGMQDLFDQVFWDRRGDGLLGVMYDVRVPVEATTQNYEIDENGNPTGKILTNTDGYTLFGNPYSFYTKDDKNPYAPYINNRVTYWKKSNAPGSTNTNDDESNYLTVGWKPKTNWTDYMLGALPGLTGLGMMLAQGKPVMSGIEAAANAYASTMGALAPVHLTHGLMKPDLTDIWNNHNILNASRLGTNRLLRNTGPTPSQSATIMANDARYQLQLGQNDLRDIAYNAEQKKAATTFNEGVARANAQFLNQGDQFNAQMLANAGEKYAQLRYNAEKEKLDQENAWRAGILGNVGSAMTGIYNAYREGQNRNERDLLAASGVFGNTNGLLDNYYGISKVDPKTGKVVRGPYTDWYWYDNDFHKQPQMAISAKGGKLNRKSKKRKGYTF